MLNECDAVFSELIDDGLWGFSPCGWDACMMYIVEPAGYGLKSMVLVGWHEMKILFSSNFFGSIAAVHCAYSHAQD